MTDLSADPSYELIGQPWELSSPILNQIPKDSRPDKLTVCATCPAAVWYLTLETLKCFCGPMKFLSWGGTERAVRGCDAREMAIMKAEEEAQGSD